MKIYKIITLAISKKQIHRNVLAISIPMVLSNVTVPLLGLVDTAIIGHLKHSWYLGGVALGNSIIMVLYFLLGFLRMSTTGLNAQAYGKKNQFDQAKIFLQGLSIALILSLLLLALHQPLIKFIFYFSKASDQVQFYAKQYYSFRIYGAPAALANMVIIGWLLGTKNSLVPMWLIIITNLVNIILDLTLVIGLGYAVKGVAIASTLADYCALYIGWIYIHRQWKKFNLPKESLIIKNIFQDIRHFIKLNLDIFLRSVCLQMVFAFMTFYGANLGDNIIAANAILLSFLMLISYGMDGFAYAIETLVGESIGTKNRQQFIDVLIVTAFWALLIGIGLTILFSTSGKLLINNISSIKTVQTTALEFMPWLIAFPLIAMWCFLLDGVFIGAARAKEMRNSMFISSGIFFLIWFFFNQYGNHALWAAMLSFMLMRNLTLGILLTKSKWFF